jgi:hypothetical protein
MDATCPTLCCIPRTSPVPCALVLAFGPELARSSTAFRKKTLRLMAASAVRKTTSGELVSSPAGLSSRREITTSRSPAVFSERNAKNCSVTERHSGPCPSEILSVHFSANPTNRDLSAKTLPVDILNLLIGDGRAAGHLVNVRRSL